VPHRHYSAEEKTLILETVQRAQERIGQSVGEILRQLTLPSATYYRWKDRQQEGNLADRVARSRPKVPLPTPNEVVAVRRFALAHPKMGYKRLTWQMVDENVAYLRPYQVYRVLRERDLLRRWGRSSSGPLKRPPDPDHPDQVWHIDLMYVWIAPRWYYLVDILDGYSRFLVHWSLNTTMLADTVTLTVQEALDRLIDRRPGEPKLVHDHGSQFLSAEWRAFVEGAGVTDIKTRIAHPQSNGRLERLHRTHREEGLTEEALEAYHQALEAMTNWSDYYNYRRPHTALKYLCPADYYRGDPQARLTEREEKLAQAVQARKAYWMGVCGC
jgi:transposase InsO family protein